MTKDSTMREVAPGSRREPRTSLVFYFRDGAKIVEPQAAPLVVGRAWPADIVIDDPSVSRSHARFFVAPDGAVCFEDLGSTNGTRLNGVPTPRGRIGAGDEVRVGDVSVALHVLSSMPGAHGLLAYDRSVELLSDELVRAPGRPLRTWAPALLEKLRPIDRAAVYATDAVLVALPESTRADAEAIGAAITSADGTLRSGAAMFPEDGTMVDELLDAARTAMLHGPPPLSTRPAVIAGERSRGVGPRRARRVVGAAGARRRRDGRGRGDRRARAAQRSTRAQGPLKSINCAATPQSLLESVLLGHDKGAFTGAEKQANGVFEQAHGGTLFLDEVGEQRDHDRDPAAPRAPRRDRAARGDVPPRRMPRNGRSVRGFDPAAAALVAWRWPGNVRELKNVVERAVVIARGDLVTVDDLPEKLRTPAAAPPAAAAPVAVAATTTVDLDLDYKERLRREMQRYETELIVNALTQANGNVTAAAQALKIPVRTLTHKMNALGIEKRFA